MKTIQSVNEVMSLFGVPSKIQALKQKSSNRGLIISIASAFLIVLAAGILLNLAQGVLASNGVAKSMPSGQEAVAFQPGRLISQEIARGYQGR